MKRTAAKSPMKVIAIVGTTASGKSDLAVKIAKAIGGEVVSADSRQVYKGLNIGSGKITKSEMRRVKHHLLDIADPKKTYAVSDYQKDAANAVSDIASRGKVAIVCGGTGFYIDALIKGIVFPDVPPNPKLRAKLEKKSLTSLLSMLKKLDAERAKTIDVNNPRRIIRAIEIAQFMKKSGTKSISAGAPATVPYDVLTIGILPDDETLRKRINLRLRKRIKNGMLNEAVALHKNGLSWKRMEMLGLEYRFMAQFLKARHADKKSLIAAHVAMVTGLETAIWQYARRQKTWFRRDATIQWNPKNPVAHAKAFLKKGPKMLG